MTSQAMISQHSSQQILSMLRFQSELVSERAGLWVSHVEAKVWTSYLLPLGLGAGAAREQSSAMPMQLPYQWLEPRITAWLDTSDKETHRYWCDLQSPFRSGCTNCNAMFSPLQHQTPGEAFLLWWGYGGVKSVGRVIYQSQIGNRCSWDCELYL